MHYTSIETLSERLRRGEVSPVEITEHMLSRIAQKDPALLSYVTVTAERALGQARAAEAEMSQGLWRGPLHGIPIALKDIIYTDFAPTTGGTSINKDFQPSFTATAAKRLETAGAITLGKVKTTEQAFADHHPSVQAPLNPWNSDFWSGVSSSGSGVSTAAGLAYGTLGSDTGGSIRLPSAANGVTGVKPTWGRVSRHGVFVLGDSLDHIGPMARSAVDAAILLQAVAGRDDADPTALLARVPDYVAACNSSIRGLRVGLPEKFATTEGVDHAVAQAWHATAELLGELGAVLKPIEFPQWRASVEHWNLLCAAEAAWAHRETHPSRKEEYGAVLSNFIELGQNSRAQDMAGAHIGRLKFTGRINALFEDIDVFLVPAIPSTVLTTTQWTSMAGEDFSAYLRFTIPADLSGVPTITLPAGMDANGMPIAMQLYGRHLGEPELFRAAAAFQRNTAWHLQRPME